MLFIVISQWVIVSEIQWKLYVVRESYWKLILLRKVIENCAFGRENSVKSAFYLEKSEKLVEGSFFLKDKLFFGTKNH